MSNQDEPDSVFGMAPEVLISVGEYWEYSDVAQRFVATNDDRYTTPLPSLRGRHCESRAIPIVGVNPWCNRVDVLTPNSVNLIF